MHANLGSVNYFCQASTIYLNMPEWYQLEFLSILALAFDQL